MKIKRLFSLLLTIALVLTLAPAAFATAGEGETALGSVVTQGSTAANTKGSITIDNAKWDAQYSIYQILVLESFNETTKAYVYKAASAWESWLKTQKTYVSFDADGYVTWVNGADAAAFAEAIKGEIKDGSTHTATSTQTAASTTVTFSDLELGYYFLTSSVGTVCSLDTTDPDVVIKDKNKTRPYIKKEVQEDSTQAWGKTNDDDIGKQINYKTTIGAETEKKDYVVHDKMSAGLTFNNDVKIYIDNSTTAIDNTDNKYYTVTAPGTEETDACTFHITFTNKFHEEYITDDVDIVITYSATLNENAVIGTTGNDNQTKLDYGDIISDQWEKTTTYTWEMEVFKYTKDAAETETSTGDDGTTANTPKKNALAGAEFIILSSDSKKVAKVDSFAKENDSNANYRIKEWVDYTEGTTDLTDCTLTTPANGTIHVEGLDSDKYQLKETKAPDGYNKLKNPQEFKVEYTKTGETISFTLPRLEVENNTGTELPSTGGIGTAMFIGIGSMLALAACVFLVTRKKMSVYAE